MCGILTLLSSLPLSYGFDEYEYCLPTNKLGYLSKDNTLEEKVTIITSLHTEMKIVDIT